jgi:uroporphyrinogen III methyltransferase / synthase
MPLEILVIREKDRFSSILIEQGFTIINFPTIKTEPLEDLSELQEYLAQIDTFDGIFITSSKAAEIVLAQLNKARKNFHGKFYVLGKRSHDLLKTSGFKVFFKEQATTAAELLKLIPESELKGKKFLFPRGNRSLRVIPEKLDNVAEVKEVVVYKTVATPKPQRESKEIEEKLNGSKIEAICFFSPSGVEEFLERFPQFSQENIKIAAIGQTTARFVKEMNLRVDVVAAKPHVEDFAAELAEYLRKDI